MLKLKKSTKKNVKFTIKCAAIGVGLWSINAGLLWLNGRKNWKAE
jgi:hypothetical protein